MTSDIHHLLQTIISYLYSSSNMLMLLISVLLHSPLSYHSWTSMTHFWSVYPTAGLTPDRSQNMQSVCGSSPPLFIRWNHFDISLMSSKSLGEHSLKCFIGTKSFHGLAVVHFSWSSGSLGKVEKGYKSIILISFVSTFTAKWNTFMYRCLHYTQLHPVIEKWSQLASKMVLKTNLYNTTFQSSSPVARRHRQSG